MRQKLNRMFCVILMLLLCCSFTVVSFASSPVTVKLQVGTMLSGSRIENKDAFEFVLKSVDTGEEYRTAIVGEGTAEFDELAFNRVGTYKYTVKQTQGADPECIYDSSVYSVTVAVFMKENGVDFDVAVTAYKDGSGAKQDSILFVNTYKPTGTVPAGSETTAVPTTTATRETTTAEEEEQSAYNPNYEPPHEELKKADYDNDVPESATNAAPSNNPITGDTNALRTWVILFAVGFVFVTGALIILVPKKRDTDEIM